MGTRVPVEPINLGSLKKLGLNWGFGSWGCGCAAAGEVLHAVTSFFWSTAEDKGKEPVFLNAGNR